MTMSTDTNSIHKLTDIGLTLKEAKVYEACLGHGEIGIMDLARLTHLSRSTTYFIADELVKKGLLRFFQKGAHRVYSAEDPRKLTLLLEREKAQVTKQSTALQSLLPTLNMRYSGAVHKPIVSFYVGQEEMQQIFEDALLSRAKEQLFVGEIPVLIESVGSEYLKSWNKRKVKARITTRGIWPRGL
ncbi:hypothetical protein KGQ71_02900 [Patescibacteria group bacterium]|nr:hypothetical protein [Patescibacteria group bacterium]